MRNKYWDDFKAGDKLITNGLTVTETHMVNFACLTGDFLPLHMDEEYAKKTIFGGRIVHGPLTYCLAVGLVGLTNWYGDSIIGLLGVDKMRLPRPVKPGDTIHVNVEVISKKETSKPDRAVITLHYQVMNQKEEEVLSMDYSIMMHRRNKAARI